MARIPRVLHEHINTAHPKNVCLVGTVQPDGYAQISPKGSVQVFDDETLAYWDRGSGRTHEAVTDGTKVMIYYRNPELGAAGTKLLPAGGIARFYGVAELADGDANDKIYDNMVQAERDRDPDKKGSGVLIRVERAENLSGQPLDLD
jgi:hypothetical protein